METRPASPFRAATWSLSSERADWGSGTCKTSIKPWGGARTTGVERRLIAPLAAGWAVATVLVVAGSRPAIAFGDIGAFDPRVLLTGSLTAPAHPTAPARWASELLQRTSAPARLHP